MDEPIKDRLTANLHRMTASKPEYLSTTDFIHLMADKGFTGGVDMARLRY